MTAGVVYVLSDSLVLLFGGGLCWLMALGQLFKPSSLKSWITAGWFFCIGYWELYFAALYSTLLLEYPDFYMSEIPFVFFTGPFALYFIKLIFEEGVRLRRRYLFHFVPGFLAILYLLPQYSLPTEEKVQFLLDFYAGRKPSFEVRLVFFLSALSIMTYIIALLTRYTLRYRRGIGRSPYHRLLLLFMLSWALTGGWVLYAIYSSNPGLVRLALVAVSLSIIFLYLVAQVFPDILGHSRPDQNGTADEGANEAAAGRRYEKSRLSNLDTDDLEYRLRHLMEEEYLYRNEDLNLASLAAVLDLTPHQLSEFLNDSLQVNLNTFLNTYRIEEARRLLVEQADRTTLSIGLEVGFNSLSSFHQVFRRMSGVSPGRYRKDQLNKL